jgi:hypothetical protein
MSALPLNAEVTADMQVVRFVPIAAVKSGGASIVGSHHLIEGGDQLVGREDRVREGRPVDLMCGVHRLAAEGGGGAGKITGWKSASTWARIGHHFEIGGAPARRVSSARLAQATGSPDRIKVARVKQRADAN